MFEGAAIRPTATAEHLVDVIGRDGLKALCDRHGGTRLYVPKLAVRGHPLAALLGVRVMAKLCEVYGGTSFDVPKSHHRRAMAMEMIRSGEIAVREIALATDYTERQIYRFIDDLRSGAEDGQMTLF